MTPFQVRLITLLEQMPMHQGSVVELAYRLKSNPAAVTSSARALEKGNRVVIWRHGTDRWAVLRIALVRQKTKQGEQS